MSIRRCAVDLRADAYVVVPYSQTVDGFWVMDGEPLRLLPDAGDDELGNAICGALRQSRQNVPTPPRSATPDAALLQMFHVTDYAGYARGTRSVGVRATDSDADATITITPRKNGGAGQGFTPIREAQKVITYGSPGQLGQAVVSAFSAAIA